MLERARDTAARGMPPDWFEMAGLILFTENYQACLDFYGGALGLEPVFSKPGLTTFQFGAGYLMVETDGVASRCEKTFAENPVTLRFNVADVEAAAAMLRARGVDVDVQRHDWGITGLMLDPDGNRVELKDHTAEFMRPPKSQPASA